MTLADRVSRACAHVTDARELRLRLLGALRPAVPFDFYAFVLTDPVSAVGSSPLADVPGPLLAQLPVLIRLKYLTPLNRWTTLGPGTAVHLPHPADSLLWRDLLSQHDITDVASLSFQDRFGHWAFLDLWRARPATAFTGAELNLLASVSATVTAALRRCHAETFHAGFTAHPRSAPIVLLLSADLNVLAQTAETLDYLRGLVPPALGHDPIPAGAYNVGAQLLALESQVDSHPPTARVHLSGGHWLTLRAARLAGNIAVSIEDSSPAERMDLFGRAFALSPRESELLQHLAKGLDTRDIAYQMHLSEHTIQDHLKTVFAKTSTTSRKALLWLSMGT